MKNLKGSAVNKFIKIIKRMWKFSTMFSKEIQFFCPQKVEKNTLKSCLENLKSTFFFLTALTAQMAQTEKFMYQNVAYWPNVSLSETCHELLAQRIDAPCMRDSGVRVVHRPPCRITTLLHQNENKLFLFLNNFIQSLVWLNQALLKVS